MEEGIFILEVEHVRIRNKLQVNEEVSFRLEKNEIFGVVGGNGSGKSTLLRTILGLHSGKNGRIKIWGENVSEQIGKSLNVGVVFQQPTLDFKLSVLRNLEYFSLLHKSSIDSERIDAVAHLFNLSSYLHEEAFRLSPGLRRKVDLGRALLHEPELLVMDEPTVNLDNNSRNTFWRHIKDLVDSKRLTVLFTTNNLDDQAYCEKILDLKTGCIARRGDRENGPSSCENDKTRTG
ncbi:ATP-binding cassette domain-containing protein [Brevibacillus sp. SIMBA_040]|uniref:ATP-binding cassette domain-containing protein n=1 Tax=unclassified Brevibacillus TaxID=2684853 RepID=UPI00397B46AE